MVQSSKGKSCTQDSTGNSFATRRTGIFFSKGEMKEVPGRIRSDSSLVCALHSWSVPGGNVGWGYVGVT